MRMLLLVGAAAVAASLAGPAAGQVQPAAGDRLITTSSGEIIAVASRDRVKKTRRSARPVRVCRKWCSADLSPCDPPSYKMADGRCDWDDY